MEPSAFAVWMDRALAPFDQGLLRLVHTVQQSGAGRVLDPLARLLGLLGAGGVALIVLGLVLLCVKKTRRYGAGVLLALALGALVTNVILKPLVARARPYAEEGSLLHQWWLEAGAAFESDLSFPSGHTTAAAAALSSSFFLGDRRRLWWVFIVIALMALSRLYLVVHYPSDVLAGAVVGVLAGLASAAIVRRAEARCS